LRQNGDDSKLYADFEKIDAYRAKPAAEFERKFIALIGSHEDIDNVRLKRALNEVKRNRELLAVYSFDTSKLEKWNYQNSEWVSNDLNI